MLLSQHILHARRQQIRLLGVIRQKSHRDPPALISSNSTARVFTQTLQGYIGSPESRLAVVEAKLRRTESELKSLRSHVGLSNDYVSKGSSGDELAALVELERPK